MASAFIKGLFEKLTILPDDWFVMQPDAEEDTAYKIKKSNIPATLTDGSGTIASGNSVDLGGIMDTTGIIKKNDGVNFRFQKADINNGDWQQLWLDIAESIFNHLDTTNGWMAGLELSKLFFNDNIGGAALFARDAFSGFTTSAGISVLKNGTIKVGDPSGGDLFSKMFFRNDNHAKWDALSASEKNRIFTDFEYQFNNFLSKLDTADQSVTSNVRGLKQITVQGATISFSATPTFNFDSGNVQKMIVTGTVTSLSISNELNSGSYRIFLEIDSVASPAIPTADATFGTMTDNSVSNPINADNDVNIYDITIDPDGITYYSIETITA